MILLQYLCSACNPLILVVIEMMELVFTPDPCSLNINLRIFDAREKHDFVGRAQIIVNLSKSVFESCVFTILVVVYSFLPLPSAHGKKAEGWHLRAVLDLDDPT